MQVEPVWRSFFLSNTVLRPADQEVAETRAIGDCDTVQSESIRIFDIVHHEIEEAMRLCRRRHDECENEKLIATRDFIIQRVEESARSVCEQFSEVIAECLWPVVRDEIAAGAVEEARMKLRAMAGDVLSAFEVEVLSTAVSEALEGEEHKSGMVLFEMDRSRLVWHLSEFLKDVRGHVDG